MVKSGCQTECENSVTIILLRMDRVYFRTTYGAVTRDREKNWPIADWHVSRNDPTINCETHFISSSLFVFRSLSGELGSLYTDVV